MSSEIKDIDRHAAKTAQAIIDAITTGKPQDTENLITKALGVLQENGVYACALFLYASKEGRIAEHIRNELLQMTSALELSPPINEELHWKRGLKFVSDDICSDLDRLLLVRQLWEQTLIYARYGAKAWKENPEAKKWHEEKK